MNAPTRWTLYPGRSRVPDAAAPDLRGRSHSIAAEVLLPHGAVEGVLISHGDRNAGYAVRVAGGRLVHDYVHHGSHSSTQSTHAVPVGRRVRVEVRVRRTDESADVELLVDGVTAGTGTIPTLARARVGYTGVDIGCDRGLTVGGYPSPAAFSGQLRCIEIEAGDDQWLDAEAVYEIEGSTG
jgi:arylsulfatase